MYTARYFSLQFSDEPFFVQGMSDLCVNPKGTVNYYVNSQPVLKNTGKIFSIFFFF